MFGGREGEGKFTGVEVSRGGEGEEEGKGSCWRGVGEWSCGAQGRRERVGGREVMRGGPWRERHGEGSGGVLTPVLLVANINTKSFCHTTADSRDKCMYSACA